MGAKRCAQSLGKPQLRPQQGRRIGRQEEQARRTGRGGRASASSVRLCRRSSRAGPSPESAIPPSQRAFCRTAAPSVAGKWPRLATTPALAGARRNANEDRPEAERTVTRIPTSGSHEMPVPANGRPSCGGSQTGERRPGRWRNRPPASGIAAPYGLAHDQLLDVRLGEFVAIMAGRSNANCGRAAGGPGAG